MPATALAQATLVGVVKDTSGAVLPGVTVEASSPVLIEKVRTTVSDGNGRFQITELRPGNYLVTFTLTGFNTVRRDGVVLSGSGSTTVDAELRVGALEETITVTGEAPVVDTQTVTKQQVLNSDTVNALPSARNYFGLARMIPGTSGGGNDVGGSNIQQVGQSVTVHGSRNTDQRITANGVNTMTLQAGGNIGGQTPDLGSASEVTVDTTSLSADLPTGGVRVNFIPRDGGNRFSGTTFFTFSNDSLQGDNYTSELQQAGLGTPNKIVSNYDVNESFGGPLRKDKVWFWFSVRYNKVRNQVAIFNNKNAFNPDEWLYEPDTAQPGIQRGNQLNSGLRITWQATPKVKIAGTIKADRWCACPNGINATLAPEAGREFRFPRLRQEHAEATSPITNRLLFEAVGLHLFERWGNMHLRPSTGSITDTQSATYPQMISVLEQSTNLRYRSNSVYNNTHVPDFTYRAAMSYVTGSQALKIGFNNTQGKLNEYNYVLQNTSYTFNNGVPNSLTEYAYPFRNITNLDRDLGIYVQDRISLNRLTVNAALRFDNFKTSFPEQVMGPTVFTPTRDLTFPAADNINWKDVTYRSGVIYDVRGNGKTALKVAFNKYLLGQTLNGLGRDPNPSLALTNSTNRSWNDRGGLGINGDYTPQCDLLNPAANGECGPIQQASFGSTIPSALFDPDLIGGWNHRQTNWELSASVQHELVRGVAVDIGYFRRIWANFRVTDNLSLTSEDFTQFSMVVPTDSRLPNSGQTVTGLFNVVPAKFGQTKNLNALDSKYGGQQEHWDGIDATVNARLQNGVMLQAGISSGRKMEDNCNVVAQLPEVLSVSGADAADTAGAPANQLRPAEYCHRQEPMLTQFKGYGVYTLPKVDVQVSGTFRSVPGTSLSASFTATNAYLAANSTLGRPLAGNQANISVSIAPPQTVYTERRNELDIRLGRVFRFAGARSVVSFDLFNALNSSAIITQSQAYSSWLRPTEILNARVAKISAPFDF
jgi:hypothetical protein